MMGCQEWMGVINSAVHLRTYMHPPAGSATEKSGISQYFTLEVYLMS